MSYTVEYSSHSCSPLPSQHGYSLRNSGHVWYLTPCNFCATVPHLVTSRNSMVYGRNRADFSVHIRCVVSMPSVNFLKKAFPGSGPKRNHERRIGENTLSSMVAECNDVSKNATHPGDATPPVASRPDLSGSDLTTAGNAPPASTRFLVRLARSLLLVDHGPRQPEDRSEFRRFSGTIRLRALCDAVTLSLVELHLAGQYHLSCSGWARKLGTHGWQWAF